MSELTDWERHRLAALERHLAEENPELGRLLSGPDPARRRRVEAVIGWVIGCVGAVLLLGGSTLHDASVGLSGFALLGFCWVPFWRTRDSARNARP